MSVHRTCDSIHVGDVVALTEDLPEHQLVRGQVGIVAMEYSATDVEVEFVDEEGRTYALVTLPKSRLLRLHYHRVQVAYERAPNNFPTRVPRVWPQG